MPIDLQLKLSEGINECVSEVNWSMIHECMMQTDWTWVWCKGTPSPEILRDTAKRQLIDTIRESIKNKETCSMSCGGIRTTCKVANDELIEFKVEFILDDWTYEI